MIFRSKSKQAEKLKQKVRKSPHITGSFERSLIQAIDNGKSNSKKQTLGKLLKQVCRISCAKEIVMGILDFFGVPGIPFGFSCIRFGVERLLGQLEQMFSMEGVTDCNATVGA